MRRELVVFITVLRTVYMFSHRIAGSFAIMIEKIIQWHCNTSIFDVDLKMKCPYPLKRQSQLQQTTHFVTSFLIFEQKIIKHYIT